MSKAHDVAELEAAVEEAFKVRYEASHRGMHRRTRIECAVLGTGTLCRLAWRGEADCQILFLRCQMYILENGALLEAPAALSKQEQDQVREIAVRAYKVMECAGMSRIDFFLCPDGTWVLQRNHTIPIHENQHVSQDDEDLRASPIPS